MARADDEEDADKDQASRTTGATATNGTVARRSSRRPALIATLIAAPVTVLAAFALTANHGGSKSVPKTGPLTLSAGPSDPTASAVCTRILAKLPVTLNTLPPRGVRTSSMYVVAWGDPSVILRCGVPRPASLQPGDTDNVFPLPPGNVVWDPVKGKDATVWTSIDRSVYVEVTVPEKYPGDGTMAPISAAVAAAGGAVCEVGATVPSTRQCVNRK